MAVGSWVDARRVRCTQVMSQSRAVNVILIFIAAIGSLSCGVGAGECDSNPCANGGTCVDDTNAFSCLCVAGYSGLQCQTDVNECASHPCMTPIRCVDALNAYECECECPTGQYCPDCTVQSATVCPGGKYCPGGVSAGIDCPAGTLCTGGDTRPIPCAAGQYCPTTQQSVVCPPGSQCLGNNTSPLPCVRGYFCPAGSSVHSACPSGVTSTAEAIACDVSCPNCGPGGSCNVGATGPLCGQCSRSYYSLGGGGLCYECPSASYPTLIFLLVFIILLIIVFKIGKESTMRQTGIRIVTTFIQLGSITLLTLVAWPEQVRLLYDWFTGIGFNLHFFHPECAVGWTYYNKLFGSIFLPCAILLVLLLADFVVRCIAGSVYVHEERAKYMGWSAQIRRIAILVVTLSYAPQVQYLTQMYRCLPIGDGNKVMAVDNSLPCYDTTHIVGLVLASLGLIMIMCGVPYAIVIATLRLQVQNKLTDPDAIQSYGAIYELYTLSMPWFDAVIMARKAFVLVLMESFATLGGLFQAASSLLAATAYLVFILVYPPFRDTYVSLRNRKSVEFANNMERVASLCTVANQCFAIVIYASDPHSLTVTVISVFFLLFNGLVILMAVVPMAVRLFQDYKESKEITERVNTTLAASPASKNGDAKAGDGNSTSAEKGESIPSAPGAGSARVRSTTGFRALHVRSATGSGLPLSPDEIEMGVISGPAASKVNAAHLGSGYETRRAEHTAQLERILTAINDRDYESATNLSQKFAREHIIFIANLKSGIELATDQNRLDEKAERELALSEVESIPLKFEPELMANHQTHITELSMLFQEHLSLVSGADRAWQSAEAAIIAARDDTDSAIANAYQLTRSLFASVARFEKFERLKALAGQYKAAIAIRAVLRRDCARMSDEKQASMYDSWQRSVHEFMKKRLISSQAINGEDVSGRTTNHLFAQYQSIQIQSEQIVRLMWATISPHVLYADVSLFERMFRLFRLASGPCGEQMARLSYADRDRVIDTLYQESALASTTTAPRDGVASPVSRTASDRKDRISVTERPAFDRSTKPGSPSALSPAAPASPASPSAATDRKERLSVSPSSGLQPPVPARKPSVSPVTPRRSIAGEAELDEKSIPVPVPVRPASPSISGSAPPIIPPRTRGSSVGASPTSAPGAPPPRPSRPSSPLATPTTATATATATASGSATATATGGGGGVAIVDHVSIAITPPQSVPASRPEADDPIAIAVAESKRAVGPECTLTADQRMSNRTFDLMKAAAVKSGSGSDQLNLWVENRLNELLAVERAAFRAGQLPTVFACYEIRNQLVSRSKQ